MSDLEISGGTPEQSDVAIGFTKVFPSCWNSPTIASRTPLSPSKKREHVSIGVLADIVFAPEVRCLLTVDRHKDH